MRILLIIFLLALNLSINAQTPKTDDLIIMVGSMNSLYINVKNPIFLNHSFDSIRLKHGNVIIEDDQVYLEPNKLGRDILFLYKGNEKSIFFFNVIDFQVKPKVIIPKASHSSWGKIQDKTKIHTFWNIPYDIKVEVINFTVRVERKSGEVMSKNNETNRFNKEVIGLFKSLSKGDILHIEKVHCKTSHGATLLAEDLMLVIKE